MLGASTLEGDRLANLRRAALPVLAMVSFAVGVTATIAVAGDTLGYDFRAYHQAVSRLLDGRPLYDMRFEAAGGFGLFYYPPTFAPLIVPFAWLTEAAAVWVWTGVLIVCFAAGVQLLPVTPSIRLWTLLLAGMSFPFVYAVKLGQVGPILFLLFAIGWRHLERREVAGLAAGLGAAIKVQPGLLIVWALLARRWRTAAVGVAVLAVLGLVATLLAGSTAWSDFGVLIGRVSDPISTPQNLTPGAVAWQLGAPRDVALALQWLSLVVTLVALLAAVRWATPEASYLVAVVASQLISPILWDHYALLLLLPVAWLLARRQWWAILVPLATSIPLVGVTPPVVYPLVFFVCLLAPILVERRAVG
jgi:alpha-1,2-mannosyltransferase